MRNFTNIILNTFLFILIAFTATAQTGEFDVRFNMNDVDCADGRVFVDVEVRANSATSSFNMSDQNYRFSFNKKAIAVGSVAIEEEFLVGFDGTGSFYENHTLTGSLDSVVSYNVVLAGGTGVLVTTDWLTVGRLSFQIIDDSECLELVWHNSTPELFPPTFIGEKVSGALFKADEGLYLNESICFGPICALPIELSYFKGYDENCAITLEWETLSETDNDYFEIQKSTDGTTFKTIGKVAGAGTSNSPLQYSFTDRQLSAAIYYRIKQVDFDKSENDYDPIVIKSNCYDENITNGITALYPNPVTSGPVNIKFYTTNQEKDAQIIITDTAGRILSVTPTNLIEGPNTLNFNTDNLSNGTYFVKVVTNNWFSSTQKFVKLK